MSLSIAVIGAGPVGLCLALRAATALPTADVTVFDSRAADADVSADSRVLALSLGSVQLLQRLGAWPRGSARPITEVDVSQQPPFAGVLFASRGGDAALRLRAVDEGVPMLGAVLPYGRLVASLQGAWSAAADAHPDRLHTRFGTTVSGLKPLPGGIEVDAGIVERFDLAVVAEGGVFADQARKALTHDYRQTAWVGSVGLDPRAPAGVAYERFTRHGPAALLPLREHEASLVWCVDANEDPVAGLDDAQRLAVLNTIFPARAGPLVSISPLKRFPLGLNAERSLTDGRIVRIGNAAQTLHPVAGQGLNLGLRDAWELVRVLQEVPDIDAALRRVEWRRAPDRWAMIAATDFLARSFTWKLPGAGTARGLGLAALQALGPVRSALARHMMFGRR